MKVVLAHKGPIHQLAPQQRSNGKQAQAMNAQPHWGAGKFSHPTLRLTTCQKIIPENQGFQFATADYSFQK
jgi:hypothetical protein